MAAWKDCEVKALLAVWSNSKIQQELDGAVRNKFIYEKISQQLKKEGHCRDWKQCRSKIKNLKTQYREVKDHNSKTGNDRKVCKFFAELESILAHRPASVPAVLFDSGRVQCEEDSHSQHSEPCMAFSKNVDGSQEEPNQPELEESAAETECVGEGNL